MCVRSAGFPADMLLAMCDEPLARSADLIGADLIGADLAGTDPAGRVAFDKEYAEAVGRLARGRRGRIRRSGFQEAVTWQNPGLARFLRS